MVSRASLLRILFIVLRLPFLDVDVASSDPTETDARRRRQRRSNF